MKKEVQQLEITTNLIRNLKGYTDERIKKEGLDRKDVITASDKTVLVTISTWINVPSNLKKGLSPTHCWVSQETICEQTLLSKRTVQDCINKLVRLGYLVQVKKGRTGVASEYQIVLGDIKPIKKESGVVKASLQRATIAPLPEVKEYVKELLPMFDLTTPPNCLPFSPSGLVSLQWHNWCIRNGIAVSDVTIRDYFNQVKTGSESRDSKFFGEEDPSLAF